MNELLALADDEGRALWHDLSLGYTETQGHPLLRKAIAALYTHTTADTVLVCAGAEEGVYVTMRTLLQPDDHAIVIWPGYQSLYQIAQSMGVQVSLIPLIPSEQGNWALDLDQLRAAIRPNTKLIATNFPHNPTGAQLTQAEWQQVTDVARDADVWLFSDEVYRWSEYATHDRLPAAADAYAKGISLGVMSKSFALAGLRIGWLASRNPDFLDAARHYKDYTSLCNSAPSEILAFIALRAKDQILARSVNMIRHNLALVEAFMARHVDRFAWIPPRAGSIAFPKLLDETPIEQFADELVKRESVLLLPGSVFDYPGNHFRLGLGRTNLPEALERLSHFLAITE